MDIHATVRLEIDLDLNAESHAHLTKLLADFEELAAKRNISVEHFVEDVDDMDDERPRGYDEMPDGVAMTADEIDEWY